MRSEKEMMDMILHVAKEDMRVRAVGMNGSRTNPNATKDLFQDYDIVYLVSDMQSFINDPGWIDVFGERMIMQTPENMALFPPELGGRFSYLMLFNDGNRIDLILAPIEEKDLYCREDKLTIILLDKDNKLPSIPAPTDEAYWMKRPSAAFFADCCNEFWWVSTYVAKGLWRKEMLYAQAHLNMVRNMLNQMLEWQVGIDTNFSVSIGKSGKYLDAFLPKASWDKLLLTYADGSYDGVWNALFTMCELFRETAVFVANTFNFQYPYQEEQAVSGFLQHVRNLPADAAKIY
ncbi:aminoglycoside 6-adenylyltransferase [Virgibacillus halotolerans]|uniref:aminoglycoside 6-adenylyltransferase n=1 Tax=Virgibacillus halotolerans TaxID=1071053 RepID=UPI00195F59CE|nr:aminoglycoside 6-adenylyltransferase [Virgibacillus halotolerans]MBM7601653.1 aminoglycoside 6-adenylyltransferase [Virgibacillus halotolerans]